MQRYSTAYWTSQQRQGVDQVANVGEAVKSIMHVGTSLVLRRNFELKISGPAYHVSRRRIVHNKLKRTKYTHTRRISMPRDGTRKPLLDSRMHTRVLRLCPCFRFATCTRILSSLHSCRSARTGPGARLHQEKNTRAQATLTIAPKTPRTRKAASGLLSFHIRDNGGRGYCSGGRM